MFNIPWTYAADEMPGAIAKKLVESGAHSEVSLARLAEIIARLPAEGNGVVKVGKDEGDTSEPMTTDRVSVPTSSRSKTAWATPPPPKRKARDDVGDIDEVTSFATYCRVAGPSAVNLDLGQSLQDMMEAQEAAKQKAIDEHAKLKKQQDDITASYESMAAMFSCMRVHSESRCVSQTTTTTTTTIRPPETPAQLQDRMDGMLAAAMAAVPSRR